MVASSPPSLHRFPLPLHVLRFREVLFALRFSYHFILPLHLFFILFFYLRMPASATMLAFSRLLSFAARAHLLSRTYAGGPVHVML